MTTIRTLRTQDKDAIESLLRKHPQTSVLMLAHLQQSGLRETATVPRCATAYSGAFRHGSLQGVVAHYPDNFVILQANTHTDELFTHVTAESSRPVKGILGPTSQVKALLQSLVIPDDSLQLLSHECLYQLPLERLRLPSCLTSGRYTARLLEHQDLELFTQWRMDYATEVLRQRRTELSYQTFAAEALQALESRHTWVLEENGTLLSTCTITAMTDEAVQIGHVWTPRDLRSREYGRSILASCLYAAWLKSVRYAVLFSNPKNKPAQHTYQALGFEAAGEYSLVIFRHALSLKHSLATN